MVLPGLSVKRIRHFQKCVYAGSPHDHPKKVKAILSRWDPGITVRGMQIGRYSNYIRVVDGPQLNIWANRQSNRQRGSLCQKIQETEGLRSSHRCLGNADASDDQ